MGCSASDRRGAGVHVRRRAHLQRHPPVADEAGQPAEHDLAVGADLDVVDDPHAVAEPLRPAELERLPDRRQPERLAGVDRDVVVRLGDAAGRRRGVGWAGSPPRCRRCRSPTTPASRCRSTRSAISVEFAAVRIAVSRRPIVIGRPAAPARNPARTASTTSSRVRPLFEVQLGCEAHLGVDDTVVGQVLRRTRRRRARVRRAVCMTADGVGEALEVQDEVAAGWRREVNHVASSLGVGGREAVVAGLGGELDDGGGPDATVEVVVQEHLRGLHELVEGRSLVHGSAQGTERPSRMARVRRAPDAGSPPPRSWRGRLAVVRMPPDAFTPSRPPTVVRHAPHRLDGRRRRPGGSRSRS